MNSRNLAIVWIMALVLPVRSGAAPAADGVEDQALEALLNREVQGPSRYAQSLLDAPAAVSVISRDESQALGHQTIGDMLSRLPGIYLSNSRTYSGLGNRGFNRPGDYSARLLMAVDGQRTNDAIYDQALPRLEFPIVAEWVKRVELVQGPGSSIYGSNALLGVVNVVTLNGIDAPGLSMQGSFGQHGQRRAELHYGTSDGACGDLFIAANFQRTSGEDLYLPELGTPDGWVRGLDGERQVAFLAKYRCGAWRLSLNGVSREKDVPTAAYGTVAGEPGTRYIDSQAMGEVAYDEGWQGNVRRSLKFNLTQYEFKGRYVFGRSPDWINKDEAYARWATLEGRVLWRGLLNHELMVGAEFRTSPFGVQRNYDVTPYASKLESDVSQDSLGAYIQDQWRASSALQLTTGLRVDRVRGFSPAVSPRAVLALRPDERESFKLMWAQSFRTPNLYERFYDDGGISQLRNASLRPERLDSLEAAWERLLNSGHALTANVYYTWMYRLIEQVPLSDAPNAAVQYRNVGQVDLRGVDLGIEQRATDGWRWRASTSWMAPRSEIGQRLSNAPRWMFKGNLASPQDEAWQLGVEWLLMGERLGRVKVPATIDVNANLRYRISASQRISLHIENALDRRNLDPSTPETALSSIPQMRRAWRLDWQFSL